MENGKEKLLSTRMIELYEQLGAVTIQNEKLKMTINNMKRLLILAVSLIFILLILIRLSK